jgi:predicted PhzF superfamily epimerase YddE/YHI9
VPAAGQDAPNQPAFQAPPLIRSGPVDDALLDEVTASLGVGRAEIVDAQWADNGPGWIAVELASAEAVLALAPGPPARSIGGRRALPARLA